MNQDVTPKYSTTEDATFIIIEDPKPSKLTQNKPTSTSTSSPPEVFPDNAIDKIRNPFKIFRENPCYICRGSLVTGMRCVYRLGMFMSGFLFILCCIHLRYEHGWFGDSSTKYIMLTLKTPDEVYNKSDETERKKFDDEWDQWQMLWHARKWFSGLTLIVCIMCFFTEGSLMCMVNFTRRTIDPSMSLFWHVSNTSLIVMSIFLFGFIGGSIGFLTPRSSKGDYKNDEIRYWGTNGLNGPMLNGDKDVYQNQMLKQHIELFCINMAIFVFGILFVLIRFYFILIMMAFKKVSDATPAPVVIDDNDDQDSLFSGSAIAIARQRKPSFRRYYTGYGNDKKIEKRGRSFIW